MQSRKSLRQQKAVKIGEDEVYMWYFSTLLTQLKYKIRHQRKGGKEKNEQ